MTVKTIVTKFYKYIHGIIIIKMIKNIKRERPKHIVVSDENFEELIKYGYANDSMNDVITRILKSIRLELGSRVGELTKL
jgi:chromatin remodeling complex protein RSC6